MKNLLYYGDNLDVLRSSIPTSSIDLVYLDPPFNSQATYNVLFKEQTGNRAAAQIQAFEDTWRWDEAAVRAFKETVEEGGDVAELLSGIRGFLGDSNLLAYLSMMAPRLLELHRVLRDSGSIFLHCDPTASHYLKMLLDAVFGASQYRNEIIWKRTSGRKAGHQLGRVHDVILFFTKGGNATWNPPTVEQTTHNVRGHDILREGEEVYRLSDLTAAGTRRGETGEVWRGIDVTAKGRHWAYPPSELERLDTEGHLYWSARTGMPRLKTNMRDLPGRALGDVWADIDPINASAAERLGYPTQKPEALMERIISMASNEGDVVLDPFCGCGTTIAAAHRLGRRWVGIDITHLAIGLMKHRLKDTFGDAIEEEFEVHGEPADVEGARYLAEADRYQFEWWALGLVGARRNEKKGADQGVDGVIWFHDEKGDSRKVVLQVKSGKVGTPALREFRQTVEAQGAVIGVFLTLEDPSKPMRAEAADAGTYQSGWGSHPKIQLLTVGQVLDGARIDMPPMGTRTTFQRAPRHQPVAAEEPNLFES